jgi:menaquinone-dependent protoporphyrinogen IX oxidase
MANASEKQLKNFVNFNWAKITAIKLKPQGDQVSIKEQKAIYLVELTNFNGIFLFGGISEKYFDKLVKKFEVPNPTKHTKNCVEIM